MGSLDDSRGGVAARYNSSMAGDGKEAEGEAPADTARMTEAQRAERQHDAQFAVVGEAPAWAADCWDQPQEGAGHSGGPG